MERQCYSASVSGNTSRSESVEDLNFNNEIPVKLSSDQVLHDTAGWKSLESYMFCLQEIIENSTSNERGEKCAERLQLVDETFLDVMSQAAIHKNRFVREMSHNVLNSLIQSCNCNDVTNASSVNLIHELLANGLADNWSQVRMASSRATRSFCSVITPDNRLNYLPLLLPRMCLNRYYVAEGVRIYSQDTWKQVFGDDGRNLVAQFITYVVDFYCSQSEAENHAVREAACACITELVLKIDVDTVKPHIDRLLAVLIVCFEDDSWPVRDAACLACGYFAQTFVDQCRPGVNDLLEKFYQNLFDNIPSVREGGAVSLGRLCDSFPEICDQVKAKLTESLKAVENQQEASTQFEGIDKSPAVYSVAKQLHDNDPSLHENQTMYSCGSLAPKMNRGGAPKGGCTSCLFRRPGQPWEITDGAVLLVGELSAVKSYQPVVEKLMPSMANIFRHKSFTHHVKLFTTVFKMLNKIADNLGKRFKMYLELFFDGLFYGLTCENRIAEAAAEDFFKFIAKQIGPNILKGRVEMYDPKMTPRIAALLIS